MRNYWDGVISFPTFVPGTRVWVADKGYRKNIPLYGQVLRMESFKDPKYRISSLDIRHRVRGNEVRRKVIIRLEGGRITRRYASRVHLVSQPNYFRLNLPRWFYEKFVKELKALGHPLFHYVKERVRDTDDGVTILFWRKDIAALVDSNVLYFHLSRKLIFYITGGNYVNRRGLEISDSGHFLGQSKGRSTGFAGRIQKGSRGKQSEAYAINLQGFPKPGKYIQPKDGAE